MKVVVTTEGPDLDSRVDPRFGRCACFLFVEIDDLSFEAVENPNMALGGGAGIQSAQLGSEKGAEVVITGNVGPNAYRTLEAAEDTHAPRKTRVAERARARARPRGPEPRPLLSRQGLRGPRYHPRG